MRIGYLVAPPALVDKFVVLRSIASGQPPLSEQAVLTEFIEEGHFGRQLRRMRVLYEERGTILYEAVSSFYLAQRKRHGLILGFAAFDARQIRDGAQKLAKALEGKLRVEDKEAC